MRPKLPLIAIAAFVLYGCNDNPVAGPEVATANLHAVPTSAVSKAPAVTFADPNVVVGSSQLLRQPKGISFEMQANLEPGTASTIWLVIFNNPEGCTAPCDEDDLFRDAPAPDVLYGTGNLVDADGAYHASGRRKEGDNSGSLWEILGLPSPGLIDSRTAEIHLIIRTHGPWIPGRTDMLTTFQGGCSFEGLPDDPRLGEPGPNTCEDIVFSVHQP